MPPVECIKRGPGYAAGGSSGRAPRGSARISRATMAASERWGPEDAGPGPQLRSRRKAQGSGHKHEVRDRLASGRELHSRRRPSHARRSGWNARRPSPSGRSRSHLARRVRPRDRSRRPHHEPLRIDGALDEPLYSGAARFGLHSAGAAARVQPATEKTELWLAFDDDNVYVSFRCWESEPERSRRQRDAARRHEHRGRATTRGVHASTRFYDRRNGVVFIINAIGGTDRRPGHQRAAVEWRLEPGLGLSRPDASKAGGPSRWRFRSSRCGIGPGARRSGASTRCRTNRWKNEMSYPHARPAGRGSQGCIRRRLAATLVGLEAPAGSQKPRDQAVRDLGPDERSDRHGRESRTSRAATSAST